MPLFEQFFCTTFFGPVCFSQLWGTRGGRAVRRTQLWMFFCPPRRIYFLRPAVFSVALRRSSVCPAAAALLTFFSSPLAQLRPIFPRRTRSGSLQTPSCVRTQWQFGLRRSSKRCHCCPKVLESRFTVCVVMCWLVVLGGGQGCTGVTMSIWLSAKTGHSVK